MKNRVRIGTCSGPAEAAFVRSVFDAHDLPVMISGEMHASAFGGLAGFIRLEIFVDQDDVEDAVALLSDIRAGDHALAEPADGEPAMPADARAPGEPSSDERADADGVWVPRHETEVPGTPAVTQTTGYDTRRRRTGIVLLLSVIVGFGTAHMAMGAWVRGIAIAVLTCAGLVYIASGDSLGGWLLFASRFIDMFGALWVVWSRPSSKAEPPLR